MSRASIRALQPLAVAFALAAAGASVPATASAAAAGAGPGARRAASAKAGGFRPRRGRALGIVPAEGARRGEEGATEEGVYTPVVYHGGRVMSGGVTVHTLFWRPPGYSFENPGAGNPGVEELIERYFTDVSEASGDASECETGLECNVFSTLTQYGEESSSGVVTPGDYDIQYEKTTDAITDTDAFPAGGCVSPQNAKACVSDEQVQEEIVAEAESTGSALGEHQLWLVFLPPNVDECIEADVCGTNNFGGYHSLSSLALESPGEDTIYAVIVDPIIEVGPLSGNDPEGNPDGERMVEVAEHETIEAMTDPEGTGWMDPDGFEVADKCEFGPQYGRILGYHGGAPYNQDINGDTYLAQEIWSNDDQSCVQGTQLASTPLPLPEVELSQYSEVVKGRDRAYTGGDSVTVELRRGNGLEEAVAVASATVSTEADGAWEAHLGRAVGDDRDEIVIKYAKQGATHAREEVILTGNGGNPFTESGWTGWTALDDGFALRNEGGAATLALAPCTQTGQLSYTIEGAAGEYSPTEWCTTTDTATVPLASEVNAGEAVTLSSVDNRAFRPSDIGEYEEGRESDLTGSLVKLTVQLGEPGAVGGEQLLLGLAPTGRPTCDADLTSGMLTCTGLVAEEPYTIEGTHIHTTVTSSEDGTVEAEGVRRQETLTLIDAEDRVLTTLHVADLQVAVAGNEGSVTGGTCSPDEYWGAPLSAIPTSTEAGEPTFVAGGAALSGTVCPASGEADGLPAEEIAQTDERSGGETEVTLPRVASTYPLAGETVYGAFTALAEASEGTPRVSLTIEPAGGGAAVATFEDVDTQYGVPVSGLAAGAYKANWVLEDRNGDTRTVTTSFREQSALQGAEGRAGSEGGVGAQGPGGAQGSQGPEGKRGPQGPPGPKPTITCRILRKRHNLIVCTVKYPSAAKTTKGTVRMSIARGARLAALGQARLSHGTAHVTLRSRGRVKPGTWSVTLVLARPGQRAQTASVRLHIG